MAGVAFAQSQIVTLTPSADTLKVGSSFEVTVYYDVSDGDNELGGLDMQVHFDSTALTYDGYKDFLDKGDIKLKPDNAIDDTGNDDGDASTDKKLGLKWTSFSGAWPGSDVSLPAVLVTLQFTVRDDAAIGSSNVNGFVAETAPGYTDQVTDAAVSIVPHGDPAKFVILDPADTTVDAAAEATIQLQDADGIVASTVSGTQVTVVADGADITEDQPITLTNGEAKVHLTRTTPGTVDISLSDTENTGYDVSSTQDVAFTHGAATQIQLLAEPAQISSSAQEEALLTATIQDQYGNTVTTGADSTQTVTFGTTDATYGEIKTGETSVDAVAGVATSHVVSKIDAAGGTITCTADAGALPQATVDVTTVPRQLVSIEIAAAGDSINVGQGLAFTATGTYDDDFEQDITDSVTWTAQSDPAGAGAFDATTAGQLNGLKPGTVTVKATKGGVDSATSEVTVNPFEGTITVTAAPASITADGVSTSTITAAVKTNGADAVDGVQVAFSVTQGTGTVDATAVTAGGNAVATYTSSTAAGDEEVTATIGAESDSATITLVPGAPAKMELEADKTTLASDQKGTAVLTVRILDANDNLVTSDDTTVVNFALTDETYAALDSATATAEGGVATTTVTTKRGTVANPPATTGVNVTSGALTAPAELTLTIVNFSIQVDAPAPGFLDGSGVHLVTSDSTPSTATFSGVGGTPGKYRWELASVGAIDSETADTVNYTAPETIEGDAAKDTLTLFDADDPDNLRDTIDINIYNPMSITWPTTEIGVAIGDLSYGATASGGSGASKFQSSAAGVATVNADTGAITPVAAGTFTVQVRDENYGDFAVANGFSAESSTIEIVNAIVIGGTPANDSMESGKTNTFTATGGKDDGEVVWEASAGTIDQDGVFTAPTVQEGSVDVTVTAYDKTYGKDHATPVKTEYTFKVYAGLDEVLEKPAGYEDGKPSTYPLLVLGKSTTLKALDDTRAYKWVAADWNGNDVVTQDTGAATFDLNPDDLFAAAGAGVYTVTVTDKNNPGLTAGTVKVRVPMKLVAAKFAGAAVQDAGTYKTDVDNGDTYTVTGGPAGDVYNFFAVDLDGKAVDFGQFQDTLPDDNSNTFTFGEITEVETFRVEVDLDSASQDADVQRLVDAELNVVRSGLFRVVPVKQWSGEVVEADGVTPISGVTVTATHDVAKTDTTDANGEFSIALEDTGVTYKFYVEKDGYVSRIVTGDQIEAGVVVLEALGAGGTIKGTVTLSDDHPAPYASGTVRVKAKTAAGDYVQNAEGEDIEALADPATGQFSFPVPAGFAGDGPFTLEYRKKGYIFNADAGEGVRANVALGDTNADATLNPVTLITVSGTPKDIDADGVYDEVLVKITARAGLTPLRFDGTATEIKVLDEEGTDLASELHVFASEGANTWSFTHDGYENFSITVQADVSVSEDRDVEAGYKATREWTYVKSATAPVEQTMNNPNSGGVVAFGSALRSGVTTTVNLPPGGLLGEIVSTVTVEFEEADPAGAGAAGITGSDMVELDVLDEDGEKVDNENLSRIEITIKFDPSVVTDGSLENGTYVIYHADTMADLAAGNASQIPRSQIILPVDYANGYVTFWVDELSAFGVGAAPGVTPTAEGDDDSGCFISTLTGSSDSGDKNGFLWLGLLLLVLVGGALMLPRRGRVG